MSYLNSKKIGFDKASFDRFKGLLSLIIIYGHTQQLVTGDIHRLLATFNVSLFLILPFLFNKDTLTIPNVLKIFKRYYITFLLFLSLGTVLFSLFYSHNLDIISPFLQTLIISTKPYIKNLTGSSYLWFLPTLLSTLLLLMIYNSITFKKLFILFIFIVHISISLLSPSILNDIPFGLAISLYLFILGLIISYLYHHYLDLLYSYKYLIFITFCILLYAYYGSSYFYIDMTFPNVLKPVDLFLFDTIQISAFFSILFFVNIWKLNFLTWVGHRSLIIYTIHPLIIFGLNILYPWNGLFEGLIKFSIIIILSSLTAYLFSKLNVVEYIYPR